MPLRSGVSFVYFIERKRVGNRGRVAVRKIDASQKPKPHENMEVGSVQATPAPARCGMRAARKGDAMRCVEVQRRRRVHTINSGCVPVPSHRNRLLPTHQDNDTKHQTKKERATLARAACKTDRLARQDSSATNKPPHTLIITHAHQVRVREAWMGLSLRLLGYRRPEVKD